jgi:hypothetical protein
MPRIGSMTTNAGAQASSTSAGEVGGEVDNKLLLVRVEEIDWIQSEGNYVRLHVGSASYLLRLRFKAEQLLPQPGDAVAGSQVAPRPFVNANQYATSFGVGSPAAGPIFANGAGKALRLDSLYRNQMKKLLARVGIEWEGWHGFRRGLATNLERVGVRDAISAMDLRHSNDSVTRKHYIKQPITRSNRCDASSV